MIERLAAYRARKMTPKDRLAKGVPADGRSRLSLIFQQFELKASLIRRVFEALNALRPGLAPSLRQQAEVGVREAKSHGGHPLTEDVPHAVGSLSLGSE
jgi:hypothetical protein